MRVKSEWKAGLSALALVAMMAVPAMAEQDGPENAIGTEALGQVSGDEIGDVIAGADDLGADETLGDASDDAPEGGVISEADMADLDGGVISTRDEAEANAVDSDQKDGSEVDGASHDRSDNRSVNGDCANFVSVSPAFACNR